MKKIEIELTDHEEECLAEFLKASGQGNPYDLLIERRGYEDGKDVWGTARYVISRLLPGRAEFF